MNIVFDLIANVLSFFYDKTSSYGLSIMLLTLVVMVAVTPLTLKGTKSMIAMQRLQPEMRKLQAKYKDDRQKLNEEMMAFYKENNISPIGGCVPLLVQAPVFIVLYRVLNGLTQMPGYGYDMGAAVGLALRNPAGAGLNSTYGTFDPGYLDHTSQMYQDLNVSRQMQSFGLDLADTFMNQLRTNGVVAALPYLLLVALIGVTAWYQQRQIQARNAGNQSQINPQQQAIMKVMPFFLPVISLTLPAGLTLYFLTSNLYRIGQQAFITRTMYADLKVERSDVPSRKDTVPTGSKGLLGGFIQLPGKADADAASPKGTSKGGSSSKGGSAKGGSAKAGGTKGSSSKGGSAKGTKAPAGKGADSTTGASARAGASSPSRSAPARSASPNRSKKKKPRR